MFTVKVKLSHQNAPKVYLFHSAQAAESFANRIHRASRIIPILGYEEVLPIH